jgi:hypothetical protein
METAAVRQQDEERPPQRRGRPFPPGTSGNPRGAALDRVGERGAVLFAAVAADFTPLSATDEVLLRQACRLLARGERSKDPDVAIRMSGEARRIIAALRKAPARAPQSFRDRLLAQLGDDDEAAAEPVSESGDEAATTPAADAENRIGESRVATDEASE